MAAVRYRPGKKTIDLHTSDVAAASTWLHSHEQVHKTQHPRLSPRVQSGDHFITLRETVSSIQILFRQPVVEYRGADGQHHVTLDPLPPAETVAALLAQPVGELANLLGLSKRQARRLRHGQGNMERVLAHLRGRSTG